MTTYQEPHSLPARTPLGQITQPSLDFRFWAILSLASVSGCNLGDFVSLFLHLGHWLGLLPLAVLFALILVAARRLPASNEGWYWTAVIVLRTAATNLADLASHTFHMPYPWVIIFFESLLVFLILPIGRVRMISSAVGATPPSTGGWYWAALLTAGALGTAIGDCLAEDFNLGPGAATLVLSAVTAVVVALGVQNRWVAKAAFWSSVVAIRAAGTTAGDFLTFTPGMGWGLLISTSVSGAIFVGVVAAWRPRSSF